MATISELLARAHAARAARLQNLDSNQLPRHEVPGGTLNTAAPSGLVSSTAIAGAASFNPEQTHAIDLALQGKSFCLSGAAGTGKTTVTQEIIRRLQTSSHVLSFADSTKHISKDTPSIIITGYTNKAVNNIKKKLSEKLQSHCITMHKLVEFAPVYYEVLNNDTGAIKTTMRFEPSRHAANPLPHISTVIFEESSMIGTDLYAQIIDALPHPHQTQMIFLGDLNQLPPVFGPSILGFKLTELPIVELTHVYRQALQSPIIKLATDIRTGSFAAKLICGTNDVVDGGADGKLVIRTWKKRADTVAVTPLLPAIITKMISENLYNPDKDMMLCPFNVNFGTVEINKAVAQWIDARDSRTVY